MPIEVRQKIANTLKGHTVSEKTREKLRLANGGENSARFGKHLSRETKAKISNANRGRKCTPDQLQRMSESHRGKRHTEEQKQNISKALKGRPISDEHRKHLSEALKGKHLSEETKRKVGAASRGRKFSEETHRLWSEQRTGKGNSQWRGGVKYLPYCPKFNFKRKEQVREAFGRVCAFPGCGKSEQDNQERLSVHHINFDKKAGCFGRMWNLAPLCRSCHCWTSEHRWEAFYILCNIWVYKYLNFQNNPLGLI